jgi:transposase
VALPLSKQHSQASGSIRISALSLMPSIAPNQSSLNWWSLLEPRMVAYPNYFIRAYERCYNFNIKKEIMNKLQQICQHAAGIDIGSEKIFIGMPDGKVTSYLTFTQPMQEAVNYLKREGIQTVAMESTGVYGVVLFDMLEAAGIEVFLVNPAPLKRVPGRKTDVLDCQWIQQLHSYGLLSQSFIPVDDVRKLRAYVRLRETCIEDAATYVNRIQKALTLMNIRLHQVIAQIQGASGMRIVKAILRGERDPQSLLLLCEERIIKNKAADVVASLQGNYKEEHLFALQQAVECYEFFEKKIHACDVELSKHLKAITALKEKPQKVSKAKPIRHHKPEIEDLHVKMIQFMNGKDLTCLPAITDYNLLQITAETGNDLSKWPTKKHFTSWLKLAPGKHSSGKIHKRVKSKATPRAGQLFREAAQSLLQSKHIALGQFARRLRARKGAHVAIKATARKLAEMFYCASTKGLEYVEEGIEQSEKQWYQQQIKLLNKKAKALNFKLVAV